MSNNKHEIIKKVEGKEWKESLDKSFEKNAKNAKIDGFRPGKVPREVFEKKYGKESLYMDAAEFALQKIYLDVLKDNELMPIVEPKIDIKNINDEMVEFSFLITTMPDVNIKKYKGLKITKEDSAVTEEEIEHEVSHLLKDYSELKEKEGSIENGNTVVLDFEGFINGVPFEGGKAENYTLEIGSNTFIPGFEEQLIGLKKDEEKDINVKFPEDYMDEKIKGKPAVFKVKIHEIKEVIERELNSDFFEDLGMEGVNSKETLKEEIKKNIEARKKENAENKYIDALLAEIASHTEVEIPTELIEEEQHRLLHDFEERMRMQGVSLDLYYEITKTDENKLKDMLKEQANSHVLYRFMLDKIKKDENITITEEEINQEIEEAAKKYKMEKDEFIKELGDTSVIKYDLEMKKIIDFLKENNN